MAGIRKSKDLFDNNIILVEMPGYFDGWIGEYNVVTKEVKLNEKFKAFNHKFKEEDIILQIKKSM